MATTPKRKAHAARPSGELTKAALLDAAGRLFATNGLSGVSIAQIATAAGCYPSQVTYYFGDKEQLLVEVACRDILALREKVEEAARKARSSDEAVHGMVKAALSSSAILSFVQAMMLANSRADLRPMVKETFDALFTRAEQAATIAMRDHDWVGNVAPAIQGRSFWSTIIGIGLERAATGEDFDAVAAERAVASVLGFIEDQD
jgi:AcrR family transcriptional regulator